MKTELLKAFTPVASFTLPVAMKIFMHKRPYQLVMHKALGFNTIPYSITYNCSTVILQRAKETTSHHNGQIDSIYLLTTEHRQLG